MIPSRPDFIIVGGHVGDEVMLMASRQVRSIDIQEEVETHNAWSLFGDRVRTMPIRWDIDVHANIVDYTLVVAKDYGQAWTDLFDLWAPPSPPSRELEGRRTLKRGTEFQ